MKQANDIQRLEFLWQQQRQYKKRWAIPLAIITVAFPLVYVPFATSIPSPLNQILLTIAMLSLFCLWFLNRLSLMTNKWLYGKEKEYRHLLEFAESDDFKLTPQQALTEMHKRREKSWGI